jgi:NAD(P)-dependent dehydrogenase (short-subunit alcohol dehydrogenase family)
MSGLMKGRLVGRAAVVTGCSSGIGLAIATRFVDEGAKVLGIDLDEGASGTLSGDRFRLHRGSVAEEADVAAALDSVTSWAGRLDVMVNNAGIQVEGTLDETSVDDFDALLAVNVRGVFIGTKLAAQRMTEGGSIVNLSSVLGLMSDPGVGAYSATKSAVVNLTAAAAGTYGPKGVRVNCICPGAVRTELAMRRWAQSDDPDAARRAWEDAYPLRRIVDPEEIASAALFLATEDSSAVTGAALVVDCGLMARGIVPQ